MSQLPVPVRFLVRITHPCPYVKSMPMASPRSGGILKLPEEARIENFAQLDGRTNFGEVWLAWNENGIGVRCQVARKKVPPIGSVENLSRSDGLTLWLDTRNSRDSHRATEYCHCFHFLASGFGPSKTEPGFVQAPIHRALQDAPICQPSEVPFQARATPDGGYCLEAFLPGSVLHGYAPEEHSLLGFYYHLQDIEHGEQFLGVSADFPFAENPTLWEPLKLVK